MEKRELCIGDVIQIDPNFEGCFFKGAFMLVTDPKPWGAVGFVACQFTRPSLPEHAYFRVTWEHMAYIGHAAWVLTSEGLE